MDKFEEAKLNNSKNIPKIKADITEVLPLEGYDSSYLNRVVDYGFTESSVMTTGLEKMVSSPEMNLTEKENLENKMRIKKLRLDKIKRTSEFIGDNQFGFGVVTEFTNPYKVALNVGTGAIGIASKAPLILRVASAGLENVAVDATASRMKEEEYTTSKATESFAGGAIMSSAFEVGAFAFKGAYNKIVKGEKLFNNLENKKPQFEIKKPLDEAEIDLEKLVDDPREIVEVETKIPLDANLDEKIERNEYFANIVKDKNLNQKDKILRAKYIKETYGVDAKEFDRELRSFTAEKKSYKGLKKGETYTRDEMAYDLSEENAKLIADKERGFTTKTIEKQRRYLDEYEKESIERIRIKKEKELSILNDAEGKENISSNDMSNNFGTSDDLDEISKNIIKKNGAENIEEAKTILNKELDEIEEAQKNGLLVDTDETPDLNTKEIFDENIIEVEKQVKAHLEKKERLNNILSEMEDKKAKFRKTKEYEKIKKEIVEQYKDEFKIDATTGNPHQRLKNAVKKEIEKMDKDELMEEAIKTLDEIKSGKLKSNKNIDAIDEKNIPGNDSPDNNSQFIEKTETEENFDYDEFKILFGNEEAPFVPSESTRKLFEKLGINQFKSNPKIMGDKPITYKMAVEEQIEKRLNLVLNHIKDPKAFYKSHIGIEYLKSAKDSNSGLLPYEELINRYLKARGIIDIERDFEMVIDDLGDMLSVNIPKHTQVFNKKGEVIFGDEITLKEIIEAVIEGKTKIRGTNLKDINKKQMSLDGVKLQKLVLEYEKNGGGSKVDFKFLTDKKSHLVTPEVIIAKTNTEVLLEIEGVNTKLDDASSYVKIGNVTANQIDKNVAEHALGDNITSKDVEVDYETLDNAYKEAKIKEETAKNLYNEETGEFLKIAESEITENLDENAIDGDLDFKKDESIRKIISDSINAAIKFCKDNNITVNKSVVKYITRNIENIANLSKGKKYNKILENLSYFDEKGNFVHMRDNLTEVSEKIVEYNNSNNMNDYLPYTLNGWMKMYKEGKLGDVKAKLGVNDRQFEVFEKTIKIVDDYMEKYSKTKFNVKGEYKNVDTGYVLANLNFSRAKLFNRYLDKYKTKAKDIYAQSLGGGFKGQLEAYEGATEYMMRDFAYDFWHHFSDGDMIIRNETDKIASKKLKYVNAMQFFKSQTSFLHGESYIKNDFGATAINSLSNLSNTGKLIKKEDLLELTNRFAKPIDEALDKSISQFTTLDWRIDNFGTSHKDLIDFVKSQFLERNNNVYEKTEKNKIISALEEFEEYLDFHNGTFTKNEALADLYYDQVSKGASKYFLGLTGLSQIPEIGMAFLSLAEASPKRNLLKLSAEILTYKKEMAPLFDKLTPKNQANVINSMVDFAQESYDFYNRGMKEFKIDKNLSNIENFKSFIGTAFDKMMLLEPLENFLEKRRSVAIKETVEEFFTSGIDSVKTRYNTNNLLVVSNIEKYYNYFNGEIRKNGYNPNMVHNILTEHPELYADDSFGRLYIEKEMEFSINSIVGNLDKRFQTTTPQLTHKLIIDSQKATQFRIMSKIFSYFKLSALSATDRTLGLLLGGHSHLEAGGFQTDFKAIFKNVNLLQGAIALGTLQFLGEVSKEGLSGDLDKYFEKFDIDDNGEISAVEYLGAGARMVSSATGARFFTMYGGSKMSSIVDSLGKGEYGRAGKMVIKSPSYRMVEKGINKYEEIQQK